MVERGRRDSSINYGVLHTLFPPPHSGFWCASPLLGILRDEIPIDLRQPSRSQRLIAQEDPHHVVVVFDGVGLLLVLDPGEKSLREFPECWRRHQVLDPNFSLG
jgi:hypothetical protein